MKIVVFGIGRYYANCKLELRNKLHGDEIIAYIDSKVTDKSTFENAPLYSPNMIMDMNFDFVILMSMKSLEMRKQLLKLGVPDEKIIFFKEYTSRKTRGQISLYIRNGNIGNPKILIITTDLNYNGGSLAAINAAKALKRREYNVWLMSPSVPSKLDMELGKDLINLAICPSLPYLSPLEMTWISQFDVVLVNVFQMIEAVSIISSKKPVIWWIHEPGDKYSKIYSNTMEIFHKYIGIDNFHDAYIVAVSKIAKDNFEKYYPNRVECLMPYGIADEAIVEESRGKEFVFAIVGGVSKLKAQHIFIAAAKKLMETTRCELRFMIIGSYGEDEYTEAVKESIKYTNRIEMLGNLSREELRDKFKQIDVVVCCSLEETMSMTITEGMMHKKICITTDATGMASYIIDGKNGFVCESGNVEALYEKMKWILEHKNKLAHIKMNARKTFEDNFTLDALADRMEGIINVTMRKNSRLAKTDSESSKLNLWQF